MGDGWRMRIAILLVGCVALTVTAQRPRDRHWQRHDRQDRHDRHDRHERLDDHRPKTFVGPNVCRTRNSTHCCPGWKSRPNSLLCIVPICRIDCGGPDRCRGPNLCECPDGTRGPSCRPESAKFRYQSGTSGARTFGGGCQRICMNGGTCSNGTCSCAPGWSGEYCTEPICSSPCLHGGQCIAPERCVCYPGLSGKRCEIDRRTGPCYTERRGALCTGALEAVVCTKQLCCATVGLAWGHPCERCGDLDCPHGHLRNLQTKQCVDIDECAAVPGLCAGGRCVNSPGSFSCECPSGQRRHPTTNNCEDIDECEDADICPNGRCVNTEGDYYCHCNPHFIPSPDKKFCIDGRVGSCYTYLSETGQCGDKLSVPLSNRDCCCGYNMGRAWGELCQPCPPRGSSEWGHLCGGGIVPPGWRRNDTTGPSATGVTGTGLDQEDDRPAPIAKVNECMLRDNICGLGKCIDKDVGYQCDCQQGAEETEVDGNPLCMDIDECALDYCKGGRCVNKPGSFECRCPPGYDPVDGGRRCSDKNECELTDGGMCTNGVCTNVDGGFECSCDPGYEPTESGGACRDVDECSRNPRVCRHGHCRNTPGSYRCDCEPGYTLSAGGYCADVDECADDEHVCGQIGGRCVNADGSYRCVCSGGYRLAGGMRPSCVDVDECEEQRVCRNAHCHNTPGSFRCDCLPGFTLSSDGRTCLDEMQDLCYEKYEDDNCMNPGQRPVTRSQCCCGANKKLRLAWGRSCKPCPDHSSSEYASLCPEQSGRDNSGADINECTMSPGICAHGACENLDPGYRCICDPGFRNDRDGYCVDVDECHMHESYCSGGSCRNTAGSFTCICPAGTRHDVTDHLCRDIDECDELSNPCDNGRCINKHGGYECECEPGFVLDASARHCLDNRRGSCWRRVVDGACESAAPGVVLRQECCCGLGLAWGSPCTPCESEHCPCRSGYAKLDGANCRDIDECMLDSELCVGGKCVNTDGSYRCECPPGLTMDDSGHLCVDKRRETCFTEYSGGRCSGGLPGDVLRAVCCCSSLGRAWGDDRCEPCPRKGTDAFNALCMSSDANGNPTIWEHPEFTGNVSDIWQDFEDMTHDGAKHNKWDRRLNDSLSSTSPGGSLVPGQMDVDECLSFAGLCNHGKCRNTPGGFTCDCDPGYEMDIRTHGCVDIDECDIIDDVCGAGECRNTDGSFSCHCRPGHRSDSLSSTCVDVDECEERDMCRGGRCVNTAGSFRCECGPGMELAPDRLSCKDVDECSVTSGICSNGACENQMGTYQCVCDEGYAQSTVRSHCEDIDECAEDETRCEHECVNTPGSYRCECRQGWRLRGDLRSCRDVDECGVGVRVCGGGDCRNTPGSYRCECGPGLFAAESGNPTCHDVDECSEIEELCGAGACVNTIGSFVCECSEGYSVKPDVGPACSDDDECELGTCDCHPAADCINLPGSFQCRCRDGWRGDGTECEDVDECVTNNGGCSSAATCHNTDGSFTCLCDTGYKGDGYSCEDIDECGNDPTLCENGHCSNTAGGYECDCDVGFTRSHDGKSCLDLDECSAFHNVCVFGRCQNTYGMFKCICDKGYQPDSVDELMPGFNCTDVDECQSPQSCQYGECHNIPGSYLCKCPPNYDLVSDGTACFDSRRGRCYAAVETRGGEERCRDSDELSEDSSMAACCCSVGAAWGSYCRLCPEPGTDEYRQLCPGGPGYQPVLEPPSYVVTLADIDECQQHRAICADGTCTNTFGSYVCSCGPGRRLSADEMQCEDIDECLESPERCGPGVCRNLPGSYVCLCPEGYVAMPNGKECVDVRQRECYMEYDEESGECSHAVGQPQTKYLCCCSVGNAWGSPCMPCPTKGSREHTELCGEKPGEYINPITNKTSAIDECALMPQLCKPGRCEDTAGGFTCHCDRGYEHDRTSHSCRDIDECQSNPCDSPARCQNTPGGYECRCPDGYRAVGRDRCEDEDECSQPGVCEHGNCRNTHGSYRCECRPGYALRDGSCHDVDECSRPRPLCRNGTCENLPGSYRCHCDDGFKAGANNDCIDVNECREGGIVCRNGRCRNTVGSFRCECSSGYALTEDGRNCRDLDECRETESPCGEAGEPQCTNTNGGYECRCGPGWRLAGRRCVDRDECREKPDACAGGECHNFDGGYRCECPSGWKFDKEAAICVDERKELCYDEWDRGRCHKARPLELARPECCCSSGAAWGRHCERCPPEDSAEFMRVCKGGMGRPNLTQDLDECAVRPDVCEGGRCINTDGSFRCACPPGYALDGSGLRCVDDDECGDAGVCGNGTCVNTDGGYECRCDRGFMQGPQHTCVDIDECRHERHGCAFRCHNTVGSYRCTCPYGYTLADDGLHCRDVDECEGPRPVCAHVCENVVGSYVCRCPHGYRRTDAPHDSDDACEDVDECDEDDELCEPGTCVNTPGNYTCDCPHGYRLSEDGHECIDHRTGVCHRHLVNGRCPESKSRSRHHPHPAHVTKAQCCCSLGAAWGSDCEICPEPGTEERKELCMTPTSNKNKIGEGQSGGKDGGQSWVGGGHGWVGGGVGPGGSPWGGVDSRGADVDECAAMPELCAPGRCINTIGSFRCVCGRGYKSAGEGCADVDECLMKPSPCDHDCKNSEGSYECLCRSGYQLDEDGIECHDIDECERGTHTCQQICTNTEGSYDCSCREGYERKGDACIDINECQEDEDACPSPGRCVNLLGSFRCVCPRGWRMSASGECVDRDECEEGQCEGVCNNYRGRYRCQCPPGTTAAAGRCLPRDGCGDHPCGDRPCFPLGADYRCGCPLGYGWDAGHAVCLQMEGGCATASCLFGCDPVGSGYRCGCPAGYRLLGAGHCVSAGDFGDAPVFPLKDQFRTDEDDIYSTEGCFSCKVNGRHRRAPDEGLVFANGTTLMRHRRRSRRNRRALSEPEAELVLVKKEAADTWGRKPILQLTPASAVRGGPILHYRIAYGDPHDEFVLNKKKGEQMWYLRVRRRLKSTEVLERQLELEGRYVSPRSRRTVRHTTPATLRLYVTVRVGARRDRS